MTYRDHAKHGLSDVECVPPVMIDHRTVILFDGEYPPAEYLVWDVEFGWDFQLEEHSQRGQARVLVRQFKITKLKAVQIEMVRAGY